jgi:MFS family permease
VIDEETPMSATEPPVGAAEPADAAADGRADGSAAADQPLSMRNVAAIWLQAFGIGFAVLMPALVAYPVVVARISPDHKDTALGVLTGVQTLLGLVLAPFFGALSDRTTSRWGMRRPGLALGALGVIAGLAVLGSANSLPVLFLGGAILSIGSAVAGASGAALVPDSVPDRTRGKVLGVQSLITVAAGLLASIVGPKLLGDQLLVFGGGAVVLVVTMAITLPLLRDRVLDRAAVSGVPLLHAAFDGYRFNPSEAPDFSWVFASRFLLTLGVSFGTTFAVYFLTDQLAVSTQRLPGLISLNGALSLVGTLVGTLVGAVAADRVRSRKALVLVVAFLVAGGAVVLAFAPTVPLFFVGTGVITFGVGLFIPTDGKLVMTVLPGGDRHVGKFMSIITIADQLPRSIGPLAAPAVIALGKLTPLGGYPVLYLLAGIAAIGGGVLLRGVRSVR